MPDEKDNYAACLAAMCDAGVIRFGGQFGLTRIVRSLEAAGLVKLTYIPVEGSRGLHGEARPTAMGVRRNRNPLPPVVIPAVPEYKVGQVWKNRRNKPTSVFLVTVLWTKEYADGNSALRVTGVVSSVDEDGAEVSPDYDLDARSLLRMFPFSLFDPERPFEIEETPQ